MAQEDVKDKADIYKQVARLHTANLDQGFLSTLGVGFLTELYRAIDQCPQAVLIVKYEQGALVGFVSGMAAPMSVVYRRMMRRFPLWGLRLFPVLFSPTRLKRVAEILRYTKAEPKHTDQPTAELLSIAVSPVCRGKGIAESMYFDLTGHFRQLKVAQFKIVVGRELTTAHKFYQRMGAQPVAEIELHRGTKSVVYVQSVIP
jgi:ribosomal protein S18 acetylase RimI-like enzyme